MLNDELKKHILKKGKEKQANWIEPSKSGLISKIQNP